MELDRLRHIGANMAGVLTCEDGTRWHPVELLPLANEIESIRQQLAERNMQIADLYKRIDAAVEIADEILAALPKEPKL